MLQRLGIRGKLLAVVAVPTIVLLLAATFVVLNAASAYNAGRNTSQLVEVVDVGTPLVVAIQEERALGSAYLRAISDGQADWVTSRTNVNTTLATLRQAGQNDPAFAPIANRIQAAIDGLDGQEGLESARTVVELEPVDGDFPVWPDEAEAEAAAEVFARIAEDVTEAASDAPVNDLGTLARTLSGFVRNEGITTERYITDGRTAAEALPESFALVDRTARTFATRADDIANTATNQPVLDSIAEAQAGIAEFSNLRDSIRSGTIQPGPVQDAYTAVIADLLNASREVASTTGDRVLSDYLTGFVSMAELVESMRLEEVYVTRKIAQGYWRLGETVQFQAYYFGTNNALTNAMNAVAPLEGITPVPEFAASYSQVETNGFETIRDRLVTDPTNRALLDQRTNEWELQVDEEIEVLTPIITELSSAVNDRAVAGERDSLVETLVTIAAAVIAVVASLAIALVIARRIVNPLRRLTTTATAVRQELPRLVERVALPGQSVDLSEVQIPVESQDEVGRLAEAFNSVNAATLSIAAEQAALRGSISEMFVNVARRDQVLLNRQLSSIDEMERTEDNQTTLTKLFALDHLATRMRRNSESLLVLAGIDTGRRLRRSMPLSDVIRTASSEIELYERVQLELDADPSMLGHSALTAAHLFAELLENATVFSDPGAPVVVRTMADGDNVVVEVLDTGIGMTPAELAEANARVASTAASEILGAQRLGLFVVGRIARRVGARVQLESVEGEGTVARVVMPPSLFDASAAYEQGHQSSTAMDEGTHAPAALVHHSVADAEERDAVPSEAQRPTASQHAYQPTVIEDGAGLAGRPAEASGTEDASGASHDGENSGFDDLVAADALAAPEAEPVDLGALTEGMSQSGLPTRRRKSGEAGSEAPQETNSIIGLPMRASDEQLTALESAATSGFTPILAADEVSPESAEQRARVFRGFRPLRGDGEEASMLAPDAESLGHAVRRGAPIDEVLGETAPSGPAPIPSLEPDSAEVSDAASSEPDRERAGGSSLDREGTEPQGSPFAVEEADPRHDESPVVRQSPLIETGYTEEDPASGESPLSTALGGGPTPSMAIPVLEDDESEAAPSGAWSQPGEEPSAGVESVTLDDTPYPDQPSAQPQGGSQAPAAPAEPVRRSALYPVAPSNQAPGGPDTLRQGSQDQSPHFESDPVTSTPSLDELIMDGSHARGSEERGGFFSRLFGRGSKQDERADVSPSPAQDPGAPEASSPSFTPPLGNSVETPFVPSPAWQESVPPASHADSQEQPQPASGEFQAAPPEEQRQGEDTSMWIGQAPAAELGQPEPGAPGYESPRDDRSAWESELAAQAAAPEPWSPSPTPPPQSGETPSGFVPDLTRNETFDAEWSMPGRTAPSSPPQEPDAFGAGAVHNAYSPDQLARPLGWEAAGESALQAAAPESATEYRPVVQIETQQKGEGFTDFTSEVFSELSSLSSSRPKVEKTRAGLAKRTPVELSAAPEASADVAPPEVPRDAEAVRNRFASFYSGTQRARDDVKNFNDSTQGSLTEP
ncbi:nitrate- and nitrite sensing domain-containing protein [Demequina sp.]|uniref:sensor histidine kinase n=1 Tax=Demequina sp. TaxID=2050685 RepID=UPI0025BBF1BB|nr:nitrate- and nitrite sensing domain-containing protein [Demequina sp.]